MIKTSPTLRILPKLRIYFTVIVFILLIYVIEKGISLDFESIQDLQPLKVSKKEVNLVLFEQIDVQIYKTGANLPNRLDSELYFLEWVPIQVQELEFLQQIHVVRKLLQVVVRQIQKF